ncbi:MAG: lipocalin-like domain-containing protein, partial [Hyphomicrobiaceae bacterium]
MKHSSIAKLSGAAASLLLLLGPPAAAQTVEQLTGVWQVVSIESITADGKRSPAFGENPRTQLILTGNGRFSQFFMRSDVPKFASGNRLTGTPEENAAVVKGANASF